MARQKHDKLTTDELLKLQEGPPLKKIRVSTSASVNSGHIVGFNDESSSTSSSTGDESTDQEDSQDDVDSSLGQVDEDQAGGDGLELGGTIEDSGRLKLSRTSPATTRTPGLAQMPKHLVRSFNDMGISSVLEAALHRMSIHTPTEVQAACIPPILAGAAWWLEGSILDISLMLFYYRERLHRSC